MPRKPTLRSLIKTWEHVATEYEEMAKARKGFSATPFRERADAIRLIVADAKLLLPKKKL